ANCSRIIIENMTLNDFGDKATRVENSDVIAFAGCGTPCMVTGCTINGGAARGIWTKGNSLASTAGFILTDNSISNVNMDGIDFDVTTSSSLAMDNTCVKNIRYGIFTEEGANLNHLIRNSCISNEIGLNLYSSATNNTIRNTLVGNLCTANQRGIRPVRISPSTTRSPVPLPLGLTPRNTAPPTTALRIFSPGTWPTSVPPSPRSFLIHPSQPFRRA
ncbi:right-handed parallel beta-helix repeat-containing protein, partial [bacterium]|nr:right-handed parallel beta-helix repeat-containing protein [bacterium]